MKKLLLSFSLSFKDVVRIVVPLLVVALFSCVSFTVIVENIIKSNMLEKVNELSKDVEYEVRLLFEPPSDALFSFDAIPKDLDKDSVQAIVSAVGGKFKQCSAFYFASEKDYADGGLMIYSDGSDPIKDYRQSTRGWFQGAINSGGELVASEPYIGAKSGLLMVSFSKAVFDSANSLVGVGACDLLLGELSEIVSGIYLSPRTHVCIVDSKGVYLTNEDSSLIITGNVFDYSEFVSENHISSQDYLNDGTHSLVKGGKFFSTCRIEGTPWFVVIEGPVSDFTGTFRFWTTIIVIIIAALIFANVVYNGLIMSKTRKKESKVSAELFAETQNLVVSSRENAATAQDQSAAVKEIVATMEDNNSLSENIAKKIKDVAGVATNTNENVNDGVGFLDANVSQLGEIADANQQTIDGIKALGEKIENIWDIVTLINSVADQAKIIAFNAELEASSAGEAGKNFHIVATEIRRLADGIIDGTKEIKSSINEIQQSSDSLILMSESGTEKIAAGVKNAKNLEEKFQSIKNASEITAESATDITSIIQQQAIASEQMLITLKQIASGVENFTAGR